MHPWFAVHLSFCLFAFFLMVSMIVTGLQIAFVSAVTQKRKGFRFEGQTEKTLYGVCRLQEILPAARPEGIQFAATQFSHRPIVATPGKAVSNRTGDDEVSVHFSILFGLLFAANPAGYLGKR